MAILTSKTTLMLFRDGYQDLGVGNKKSMKALGTQKLAKFMTLEML